MTEARPVLFLDIDGVLNGREFSERAGSNTIDPACAERLNRVITATDCALVISSAWRYMVLEGAMTLRGFEHLLRTHGVDARGRVVGTTGRGEEGGGLEPRRSLIMAWLRSHPADLWAVVDDNEIGGAVPFVKTDGQVGLTDAGADRLILLLRGLA